MNHLSTPDYEVDEQYQAAQNFADKFIQLYLLGTTPTKLCLQQIAKSDHPEIAITAWLQGWQDSATEPHPNGDIPHIWRDPYSDGWRSCYVYGEMVTGGGRADV